jgi:phosphatidylserine decarboxylase
LNFAREGYPFIGIATILAIAAFALAIMRRSWALWLFAILVTLLALWVAYFFRDPERIGERGAHIVVAPADGKLIMITEVDEPAFIQGRAMRRQSHRCRRTDSRE